MEIERAIETLRQRSPEAVDLAELLSIASRVEPALLRRMRLALLPHSDAGAEAELWFSPLVQSQNASGFVLDPRARAALRPRLAATPARLQRARQMIAEAHAGAPEALRLEEEVTFLALTGSDAGQIAARLDQALHALLTEGDRRPGLAQWAARALPALPESARQSESAWLLATAANAQLGGPPILGGDAPAGMDAAKLRAITSGAGETWIGVRLLEDGIEFGDATLPGAKLLRVPKVSPVAVEVASDTDDSPAESASPQRLSFPLGESRRLRFKTKATPPTPVSDEKYVYLCYSRNDREWVEPMVSQLASAGVKVWMDRNELSAEVAWEAAIQPAIQQSSVFLVIASLQLNRSDFCRRELQMAEEIQRERAPRPFILPVFISPLNMGDLPPSVLQFHGPLAPSGRLSDRDVMRIRQLVEEPEPPTEAATPGEYLITTGLGETHRLRPIVRTTTLSAAAERLRARLEAPGPKRILSIEAGGMRLALALGFLARIEALLREQQRDPELRLADYFDLIGGTSAGGILAAALASGMSVEELSEAWPRLAGEILRHKRGLLAQITEHRFDDRGLNEALGALFGNRTLTDDSVRTGLCLLAKRADTGGLSSLLNHPASRYYAQRGTITLREAVRAGMAAPMVFAPVRLALGESEPAAFIDASVSTATDPALHLFRLATSRRYPFRWEPGADRLLLVSLGAGSWRDADRRGGNPLAWATGMSEFLMRNAERHNASLLETLAGTALGDPRLRYLRYDVVLEEAALRELGVSIEGVSLGTLRNPISFEAVPHLLRIGEAAARRDVNPEQFPPEFLPTGHGSFAA